MKGEAIEAPAGRADDFAWPRRDIVTATGVLPPDPVEPPPRVEPAVATAPAAPAGAAAPPSRRQRRAASAASAAAAEPDGSRGAVRNTRTAGTNQRLLRLVRRRPLVARATPATAATRLSARSDELRRAKTSRRSARQGGRSHQELVDRVRGLAALADRPDDQRLAAPHVAGGEHLRHRRLIASRCRPRRCRAGRASTPSVLSMPSCTGCTKPMASSTRSALRSNSVPGIGLNLSSTRTQSSFCTWPFSPVNFCVITAKSRSAPSSWLDEVRSFSGQFGQVRSLSLLLGRLRHDLEVASPRARPAGSTCRCSRSRYRRRRSPPHACRRRGSAARRRAARRATRRFCCGRKSIAKWMPSRSRPGIGRSRGFSAPPASTTAS